jgi:hypothetical protein
LFEEQWETLFENFLKMERHQIGSKRNC